jgi:serine phosphatase RsbU (regulator of sigma subunit)
VPIGVGFAGRIAAERQPIVLDRVDETTVSNPILWQSGVRAMLGVPLYNGPTVIGVLHVGTRGDRLFHDDDAHLLEVAAERLASAIRLRLLESERAAAEALQRSLIPNIPTDVGELEFASRYVPTEHGGIGGDWYDVFRTGGGDVWVVTGDVAGHGLRAAVVMGRIRSALRSYALITDSPSEVLALTDRKVQHFEVGQMATVAVAVIRSPYDAVELAIAGHPPPVIAEVSGPASLVEVEVGPPLGVAFGDQRWPATSFAFRPGSVLVLYTDGLVERRGEDLDVGLERLRAAVAADHPQAVCQTIMGALVGNHAADDDVALLAIRRGVS